MNFFTMFCSKEVTLDLLKSPLREFESGSLYKWMIKMRGVCVRIVLNAQLLRE